MNGLSSAVSRTPSTAAYLIFCDGREAYVLEKDHRMAHVSSSSEFIVATNCDFVTPRVAQAENSSHWGASMVAGTSASMEDLIEDSTDRRRCMQANWDHKVKSAGKNNIQSRASGTSSMSPGYVRDPQRRTRSSRNTSMIEMGSVAPDTATEVTASQKEIIKWTATYPITNEMTHYAAVMDPMRGAVVWVRRFVEPVFGDADDE